MYSRVCARTHTHTHARTHACARRNNDSAHVVSARNDILRLLRPSSIYFRIPRAPLVDNAENPACIFLDKQGTRIARSRRRIKRIVDRDETIERWRSQRRRKSDRIGTFRPRTRGNQSECKALKLRCGCSANDYDARVVCWPY